MAVGLAADALHGKRKILAAAAEPVATSIVGAWVSTLIMAQMGKTALFSMLSIAFCASSAPGALIGAMTLVSLHSFGKRKALRGRN